MDLSIIGAINGTNTQFRGRVIQVFPDSMLIKDENSIVQGFCFNSNEYMGKEILVTQIQRTGQNIVIEKLQSFNQNEIDETNDYKKTYSLIGRVFHISHPGKTNRDFNILSINVKTNLDNIFITVFQNIPEILNLLKINQVYKFKNLTSKTLRYGNLNYILRNKYSIEEAIDESIPELEKNDNIQIIRRLPNKSLITIKLIADSIISDFGNKGIVKFTDGCKNAIDMADIDPKLLKEKNCYIIKGVYVEIDMNRIFLKTSQIWTKIEETEIPTCWENFEMNPKSNSEYELNKINKPFYCSLKEYESQQYEYALLKCKMQPSNRRTYLGDSICKKLNEDSICPGCLEKITNPTIYYCSYNITLYDDDCNITVSAFDNIIKKY